MKITIDKLLQDMFEAGASDLHISAGCPPIIRLRGKLTRLKGYPELPPNMVDSILTNALTGMQNEKLIEQKELDFSYEVDEMARFRGNIFIEKKALGAVFRMIPHEPYSIEALGVPLIIKELARKRQGLILITGPTSSGKTTTLAGVVKFMNSTRNSHIVTIEDPIEYIFHNNTCLIRQREVGAHTHSFARALNAALRQDPDVILVGEMRDKETIETVLTAAETGHLVFTTLHTNNAVDSIHRILDVFHSDMRNQISLQLSATLHGIFSQQLIPHKDRTRDMVLATEVLIVTPGVRNMIRENKIHMIRNAMFTGSEYGMQTMEQSLFKLYRANKITTEEALNHAFDIDYMKKLLNVDKNQHRVRYTGKKVEDINTSKSKKKQPKPHQKLQKNEDDHYYQDPMYADQKVFGYYGSPEDEDVF